VKTQNRCASRHVGLSINTLAADSVLCKASINTHTHTHECTHFVNLIFYEADAGNYGVCDYLTFYLDTATRNSEKNPYSIFSCYIYFGPLCVYIVTALLGFLLNFDVCWPIVVMIRDGINLSNWRPHKTVRAERRVHGSACVLVTSLISVAKDRSRRRRGLGRVTIRSVILTRTPSPDALLPQHLVSVPMYAQ